MKAGFAFVVLFGAITSLWAGAASDIVDVSTMKCPPLEEIRYATPYNFTGTRLYPSPAAYVRKELIPYLEEIQEDLAKKGLGLKIYDGYRPLPIQQKMWDLILDERFVSNPAVNRGRHTRGTAVDVTLVDKIGNPLPMPSDFDEFSPRAAVAYTGGTPETRRNRELLQKVMTRHGFLSYPHEWWHFDFQGWEKYEPLSIGFAELQNP
ncbi:MAG: M15 family metallopeptidase [Verrucomicrobiota bacterium]